MRYITESTINALKKHRRHLKMSQREVSALSMIPQGQISKIENNEVDLRLSSLLSLAFALELDLMLVPRKIVPAVETVIDSLDEDPRHPKKLKPMYRLDNQDETNDDDFFS
jgi:transcriptional regulator with XRE-family HTH domain